MKRHEIDTMWKPIATAPKDGTHILVCKATDADGQPMGDSFGLFTQRAAWWDEEGWIVYCGLFKEPSCFFDPTHWMPIPPAPQVGPISKHTSGSMKRIKFKFTCCNSCHAEHSNKFTAWIHWAWLRAKGQA